MNIGKEEEYLNIAKINLQLDLIRHQKHFPVLPQVLSILLRIAATTPSVERAPHTRKNILKSA